MIRKHFSRGTLTVLALLFISVASVQAADPCCPITAIDARTGVVTAQVKATGKTFQFQVKDRALLSRLRIGQSIFANFGAKQVSLDGRSPCCAIVATGSAPPSRASDAHKGEIDVLSTKAPTQPAAESAAPAGPESTGDTSKPVPQPSAAVAGAADPEEVDPSDPEPARPPIARGLSPAVAKLSAAKGASNAVRLKDHPDAQKIVDEALRGLRGREINVALLGGERYMIHNCLGLKASAGGFKLALANPNLRFEETGVRLTFQIPRVSMNALTVRMRPNPTNLAKPCSFSRRFGIGGSASDLRMEMRFDPLLDLQQCKLGSVGKINTMWRIGGLNLRPLQNDLDRAAKNMIEDSLTYVSNFNLTDRVIAAFNGAIGLQCKR